MENAKDLVDNANGQLRATVKALVDLIGPVPVNEATCLCWLNEAQDLGLITQHERNLLGMARRVRKREVFA